MNNLAIKAVELGLLKIPSSENPFTSRSGEAKKYLIDARGAGSNLELRKIIISEMLHKISNLNNYQVICGIAKSGIMWGSWLSWELNLPYATVLIDGPRLSGMKRQIEGEVSNKDIILVDNWIRDGISIKSAAEIILGCGGKIIGGVVITRTKKIDFDFDVFSVWELEELFDAARKLKVVPENYNFYK